MQSSQYVGTPIQPRDDMLRIPFFQVLLMLFLKQKTMRYEKVSGLF